MTLDFSAVVLFTSLIVAMVGAIVMAARSRENRAYLFLAAFIFASNVGAIVPVLAKSKILEQVPFLIYFPLEWNILALPFLFAFLTKVSGKFTSRKTLLVFIVPVLVLLSYFYFWSFPDAEKIMHLTDRTWAKTMKGYRMIDILYNVVVIIICLIQVKRYEKQVDLFYSQGLSHGFVWVKVLCFYSLALYVFLLIPRPMIQRDIFFTLSNSFTIAHIILIIWIIINSTSEFYQNIPPELSKAYDPNDDSQGDNVPADTSRDAIFIEQISKTFEKTPFYRKKDLNLQFLAKQLGMSPRKLSNLINQRTGKNFRGFINSYRVAYAKKLLKEGVLEKMTINGLAQDVGFQSRTTFYSAFKQETGVAPMEFLHQSQADESD